MSRSLLILLAAVVAVAALRPSRDAAADSRPLPPDLALVPANAVGFAHLRAADLWKRDDLKPYRDIIERAGSKAFAQLDEHFEPKPSTTDRVTLVLLLKKESGSRRSAFEPFEPTLILHFNKPYDRERVLKAHAEKSKTKTAGGKEYFLAEKSAVAIAFADPQTLVLGDDAGVAAILAAEKKDGPLTPALRAAAEKPITVGLNVAALPIPAEVLAQIPDEYKPLTELSLVSGTIDLAKEPVVDLKLTFPNADSAATGEKALRKLATLGRIFLDLQRKQLQADLAKHLSAKQKPVQPIGSFPQAALAVAGLGGLNFLDDFLAHPPIELAGASLTTKVKLPEWTSPFLAGAAISAGVGLPGVQKVREAAESAIALNNLKQIAIALHSYHDVHGALPPAAILGKKGKKLLSWRVAILPFIEQENVYRLFKQDEPWDSEHNKKLSDLAIKTYMDPRAELKPGQTNYKAIVGDAAMFDAVKGRRFAEVTDGLSNTLMVMAGGDPVPWAKPDDYDYDPKKEFPADYAKAFDDALLVLFADGSVRAINLATLKDRAAMMKLLIERNDGMAIPNFFE
jgi:Protein of unknown function (DUF1559)